MNRLQFVIYLFFLLSGFLSLQGCVNSSTDEIFSEATKGEGEQDQDGFSSSFPFPFDTKVNQIAYMSCHSMKGAFNKNAYFSLFVGAHDVLYERGILPSGIRFSNEFLKLHKASGSNQKIEAITGSTLASSLRLQFGIHRRLDLGPRRLHTDQPVLMVDKPLRPFGNANNDFVLRNLANLDVASNLNANEPDDSPRTNYFFNAPGLSDRYIRGRIYANSYDREDSVSFRNELLDESVLTVGYTTEEFKGRLMTDSGEYAKTLNKARGTGFGLTFSSGRTLDLSSKYTPTIRFSEDNRVLTSVSEFDLQSSKLSSDWTCQPEYQFMILKESDVDSGTVKCGGKYCVKNIYPRRILDAEKKAILEVLRPEDWYINFEEQYVIARKDGGICYSTPDTKRKTIVNYNDRTENCGPGRLSSDGSVIVCPHYVSFCTRAS